MHILISGAAGDLGRAVVARFYKADHRLLALIQPNEPEQLKVLHGVANGTNRLIVTPLDVLDAAEVDRFATSLPSDLTTAVLLVGGFGMGDVESTDEKQLDQMISLNFKAAYHLARHCFLHFQKHGGGRIVLIGARPALDPQAGKGTLAYALSKGMVAHLADLLNAAGANHDIVTTLVVPSILDTPANRDAMPDADFDTWPKPAELADAIYFACSPQGAILRQPVLKVYGQA